MLSHDTLHSTAAQFHSLPLHPDPPPLVPLQHQPVLLAQNLFGKRVVVIAVVYDRGDAGVEDHLGADDAREAVAIERRPLDADAELRGLRDGVLFGVRPAADLVPLAGGNAELLPQAPAAFRAVRHTLRRAVVPGRELLLVLGDHRPHLPPQAGRALGPDARDSHEYLVERRPVLPRIEAEKMDELVSHLVERSLVQEEIIRLLDALPDLLPVRGFPPSLLPLQTEKNLLPRDPLPLPPPRDQTPDDDLPRSAHADHAEPVDLPRSE